ncbi:MAG: polysaccharide deacetylase family protein [Bdellovibrionales bacterium]|nr:polysaccharide deacetylase family protein [Bdellovibrionales bacterium]
MKMKFAFAVSSFLLTVSLYAEPANYLKVVQSVVDTHRVAATYSEWKSSHNNPHHLLDSMKVVNNKIEEYDQEKLNQLCAALETLSNEDASLFYSDLSTLSENNRPSCITRFLNRQNQYFNNSQLHIQATRIMITPMAGTLRTISPSQAVTLDVTGGPRYVTADLPQKTIAFTFDDGPHKVLTPKLLQILKDENIQSTFFVVGQNVKRYPEMIIDELSLGHTVGTHSWSHKQLPKLRFQSAVNEIDDGFISVIDTVGKVTPFFRFPYGARNSDLKSYLQQSDIADFFWTIDTLDWKIKNPEKLLDYALEQIENVGRGIVLFHDVQPQTIAMFPSLIALLNEKGYKTVVFQSKESIERVPKIR